MKIRPVQDLVGHEGRAWHCAWNPSGTLLATCGEDTKLRIWGKEGDSWILKVFISLTQVSITRPSFSSYVIYRPS